MSPPPPLTGFWDFAIPAFRAIRIVVAQIITEAGQIPYRALILTGLPSREGVLTEDTGVGPLPRVYSGSVLEGSCRAGRIRRKW